MVSEEEDIVYSVIEGGSESNRKAFESNAYSERDTFQCDSTIGLNLSKMSSGPYSIGASTPGKALGLMAYLVAGTSMFSAW